MQRRLFIILAFFSTGVVAQPYIDLFNARYMNVFGNGNKSATPFTHAFIGLDIPFKLKNNKIFVLSPFYDNWNIDSSSDKNFLPQVSSMAVPITGIFPSNKAFWSFAITAIPRFNSEALTLSKSFQIGGVVLANYKRKENLIYKFGVYVNNDFFGIFVMPLVGIDWRINDHNNLFGILPGRLTYEHKWGKGFYTGVTFRAITNSYRLQNGNYLRIDDNQLSAFLDYYLLKHIVFTAEPGYGLMRKLRSGKNHNKNYHTNFQWGDGFFIKLSASYRIRL